MTPATLFLLFPPSAISVTFFRSSSVSVCSKQPPTRPCAPSSTNVAATTISFLKSPLIHRTIVAAASPTSSPYFSSVSCSSLSANICRCLVPPQPSSTTRFQPHTNKSSLHYSAVHRRATLSSRLCQSEFHGHHSFEPPSQPLALCCCRVVPVHFAASPPRRVSAATSSHHHSPSALSLVAASSRSRHYLQKTPPSHSVETPPSSQRRRRSLRHHPPPPFNNTTYPLYCHFPPDSGVQNEEESLQ
ncbi:hypothetical protein PIB30_014513 [Stylosanthes scabra]|uniref:Uncharacterized protein n=1 Tax=Stylosanthes scabra TaxID=79078 RepID=A0ABU6X7J7_9FABA|nr:hypothetical protein [Stylosanthes scabra]